LKLDKKAYLKIGLTIVAITFASQFLGRIWLSSDSAISEIELYVTNNESVRQEVGTVRRITVTRKTSFNGSVGREAYNLYLLWVEGDASNAWVTAKITWDMINDGAMKVELTKVSKE
jgi:hypothetical protein